MKKSSSPFAPWLITVLLVVVAAGVSILLYFLLFSRSGGMTKSYSVTSVYDYLRPVILFIVMVFGMFFNQLFESLQKQKKQGKTTINVGETFRNGFKGITFWMALFVSPIVFFGTYFLVSSIPDDKVAWFYAFQNGFFWYYIFNKFELRAKADGNKAAVIS